MECFIKETLTFTTVNYLDNEKCTFIFGTMPLDCVYVDFDNNIDRIISCDG